MQDETMGVKGHLVREETPTMKRKEEEEDKAGYSEAWPSQEQMKEEAYLVNVAVTTQSLSLREL